MEDGKRIAAIIRDHLARERISREQFAFKTKLGKSTVDKLLIGLFSDRTLSVVEGHTGLSLRTTSTLEQPAVPRGVFHPPFCSSFLQKRRCRCSRYCISALSKLTLVSIAT